MENFTRMSEAASPELKDIQTVKILICYLLYRINKPIDSEQLYRYSLAYTLTGLRTIN
mgnify:FL=1